MVALSLVSAAYVRSRRPAPICFIKGPGEAEKTEAREGAERAEQEVSHRGTNIRQISSWTILRFSNLVPTLGASVEDFR